MFIIFQKNKLPLMPDVADDVKYSEIRDIPWETEDCQSSMKIAREMIFVMISILVFCNKKITES